MKVLLPNGTRLEGTAQAVAEVAAAMGVKIPTGKGDEVYYFSEKEDAFVPISEMHAAHIKNALLKLYRGWVSDLSQVTDYGELLRMVRDGPTSPVIMGLLKSLARKVADGDV